MSVTTLANSFAPFGPLASSEVWTTIAGVMQITADATETDADKGMLIFAGQQLTIPAGLVVYAKAQGNQGCKVNRDIGLMPIGVAAPTDKIITGPAAQSVLNTDLITGTVSGWYDVSAFNSGTLQVIGSARITAGVITFEATNDISLAAGETCWS